MNDEDGNLGDQRAALGTNSLEGLVDAAGLVNTVFSNAARKPCIETIMRAARAGDIPSVKFGRRIYFHPAAVMKKLVRRNNRRNGRLLI